MSTLNTIQSLQKTAEPALSDSKILLSKLNQFDRVDSKSAISIKIVLQGEEQYRVNNQRYTLTDNNYIIVNQNEEVEIKVDSKKTVKGLCIYPPIDIIQNVFSAQVVDLDKHLFDCSNSDVAFTSHQCHINHTKLGEYLKRNINGVLTHENIDFLEFYLGLAEAMVIDQLSIEKKMIKLNALKRQTREELYRRINIAKAYIHDHQNEKLDVNQLCQISSLSKYHFIRGFKRLFRKTPYQYLLSLKLQQAKQLLTKGYSYREITEIVGFSDVKNLKKALNRMSRNNR